MLWAESVIGNSLVGVRVASPGASLPVALVATLPALAVPAAAAAMDSPDAELLGLGKQLDQVIADYNAQQLKDRAEREPFGARVEQVTGIALRDGPLSAVCHFE
jgi:hypothetical protein